MLDGGNATNKEVLMLKLPWAKNAEDIKHLSFVIDAQVVKEAEDYTTLRNRTNDLDIRISGTQRDIDRLALSIKELTKRVEAVEQISHIHRDKKK